MLAPKTSIAGAWAGRRWSGFGGLGSLWKVMATQNLSKWQVNIVPKCSQRVEVWAVGCWLDYVRFVLGTQAQWDIHFTESIMDHNGTLGKGSPAPHPAALEVEVATPPETLSPKSDANWGSWKRSRQPLKTPGWAPHGYKMLQQSWGNLGHGAIWATAFRTVERLAVSGFSSGSITRFRTLWGTLKTWRDRRWKSEVSTRGILSWNT